MSGTPLWLDLEPQYIDKNFKKVIGYLSAESKKVEHDSFYSETVSLLAKRSAEIMANLSS